jgi:adenine C2-methylase RlmN of 23S rRNA A2503 and tRNA A37
MTFELQMSRDATNIDKRQLIMNTNEFIAESELLSRNNADQLFTQYHNKFISFEFYVNPL